MLFCLPMAVVFGRLVSLGNRFRDIFEVPAVPNVPKKFTAERFQGAVCGNNRDLGSTTKHVTNEGTQSMKWTNYTADNFVDESTFEELPNQK